MSHICSTMAVLVRTWSAFRSRYSRSANSLFVSTIPTAPPDAVRHRIQFEIGNRESACLLSAAPTQKRAGAGDQFREREGFGEIIVGAGVQAVHFGLYGFESSQQEDRSRLAFGAEARAYREPINLRQHNIEDDKIIRVDG